MVLRLRSQFALYQSLRKEILFFEVFHSVFLSFFYLQDQRLASCVACHLEPTFQQGYKLSPTWISVPGHV